MKSFIFTILILIAVAIGWVIGRYHSSNEKHHPSAREASFRLVVESYVPSCSELQKEGVFNLQGQGQTRLYLEVTSDKYKVVGVNEESGRLPLYWWAGASRQGAMSQACAKP